MDNLNGTIKKCTNTGRIIGYGSNGYTQASGIVGAANCNIENCINKGNVTGNGDLVGGIAGVLSSGNSLTNCSNEGTIIGNRDSVGGIAGTLNSSSSISNCSNFGKVIGSNMGAGGIAGIMSQNESTQIANSTIEKSYNMGEINGNKYVGGITGWLAAVNGETTLIECYNKGKISGTQYVGEITGYEKNTTDANTLNKLFYLRNERNLKAIGNKDNDDENQIMAVDVNLTYEQFKTWIKSQ